MAASEVHSSDMEKFIRAFLKLDKNDDEMIDRKELEAYCKQHKLDASEIDEWMKRFDTDKDGKISLDEFCRGFGLKADEMRIERTEIQKISAGNIPALPKDIKLISSTMPETRQVEVTEKFIELLKKEGDSDESMAKVSTQLRDYLEKNHGCSWQLVILNGSYWLNFTHEPFQSLQFQYGKHICLLWRTPSG